MHTFSTCQSFTMETILATAFGRVIDVQRGEADELTKACTSLFTDVRERITYAELVIVLLCELHSWDGEKDRKREWEHGYLPSFLLSTLVANFPCLVHISRFLLSSLIKDNLLNVLHSTALGLVKARREEGESKVGISLSLPVSKSSAIFLHWIISACSLYAQKYVQKSKIAEISLKVSYAMTFLVSEWSSPS